MLRITDARTGDTAVAAPVRRGLTRVEAHACGYGTGSLRILLVADVLVRALELGGTPVWPLLAGRHGQAELLAGAAALNVHPFEDSRGLAAGLGEAQALHVVGLGRSAERAPLDGARLTVAPVTGPVPDDLTALRLALLARPRTEPVRLDAALLGEAHDTLVRWRRAVADWARRPSRPVPDEVRGRLRTAWEDDLNVPEVLRVLRWVEDAGPALPDGARFETYSYADRFLGLELTRDLGGRPA